MGIPSAPTLYRLSTESITEDALTEESCYLQAMVSNLRALPCTTKEDDTDRHSPLFRNTVTDLNGRLLSLWRNLISLETRLRYIFIFSGVDANGNNHA